MRIEYIAQTNTLSIELPGAKLGDTLNALPPAGLLYWYDARGKLKGVTIPDAADVLGWEPEVNTSFHVQRRRLYDEKGREIGWETVAYGANF